MNISEFVNRISERVCGCREAREEEIMDRIEYLVELEKSVFVAKNKKVLEKILDKARDIEHLMDVLDYPDGEDWIDD
jgi:Na+/phosphate symporter